MSDRYLTIDAAPGEGVDVEVEVKRSRFLTRLRRVATEEQARAVIEERRSTHFGARHHCSAFMLGPDGRTARSSDDGEPAGTAGVPMLTVLQRSRLSDVVAVVTRYFGGVKLGAAGLARAYGDSVAHAVGVAGTREVVRSSILRVDTDFANTGVVEDHLRGMVLPSGDAVVVERVEWLPRPSIWVAVPAGFEDELDAALASLSGGRLHAQQEGDRWVG